MGKLFHFISIRDELKLHFVTSVSNYNANL